MHDAGVEAEPCPMGMEGYSAELPVSICEACEKSSVGGAFSVAAGVGERAEILASASRSSARGLCVIRRTGECPAHPRASPLRRCAPARPACGCPDSSQANLSNPRDSHPTLSLPDTQNAPFGALCVSGGPKPTKQRTTPTLYPSKMKPENHI